jgi:hypothetical protein
VFQKPASSIYLEVPRMQGELLRAFGWAMLIHFLVFFIWQLLPREPVTEVPVRIISFQLEGAGEEKGSRNETATTSQIAASQKEEKNDNSSAISDIPQEKAADIDRELSEALNRKDEVPEEKSKEEAVASAEEPPAPERPRSALSAVEEAFRARNAVRQPPIQQLTEEQAKKPLPPSTPKRFVRPPENSRQGTADSSVTARQGSITGSGEGKAQSGRGVISRNITYEQQLFRWFAGKRDKGRIDYLKLTGVGEVRIQIDRRGAIIRYWITRSTSPEMMAELKQMILRANPVPVPPSTYFNVAGYNSKELLEFAIPVKFSEE